MRILDSISKNIQIFTSEPVSETALDCTLIFFDASTNAGTQAGINTIDLDINEDGVDIIPSTTETEQNPTLKISKDVRFISLINIDTIDHVINIMLIDNDKKTQRLLFKTVLKVDWRFEFISGKPITIYDEDGLIILSKDNLTVTTAWGAMSGDINDQDDLQEEFNTKQDFITSPTNDNIVTSDTLGQVKDSGKTFTTDITLSDDSDNLIPTEKAVKTYVDNFVDIVQILVDLTVTEDIYLGDIVNGDGSKADSSIIIKRNKIIGLSKANILSGFSGKIVTEGEIENPSWSWVAGDSLYLNGTSLSTTPPDSGFVKKIGVAKTPIKIEIILESPILI